MPPSNRITFKGTAVGLVCCAVVVAFLNLYMNFLATRSSASFQIDLSADGDVVAFHQFDFPGANGHVAMGRRGGRPRVAPESAHSNSQNSLRSSCMGLCPSSGSLFTQVDYVKNLIHARMKNLPSTTFRVVMDDDKPNFVQSDAMNSSYLMEMWHQTSRWVSPRKISSPDDRGYETLIAAFNSARIIRVATPRKGTQLKAMVLLEGGQWTVWKPKLLDRTDVVEGGPTDGPDRHNGEIAAFYIGHMLGFDRTPFVAGRIVNMRSELMNLADNSLKDTFFVHNQTKRLCFYGKCIYCSPSLPACADTDDRLEGAMVFWFPPAFANLTRLRSPWARTYDQNRLANWQSDTNFCSSNVVGHEVFGKAPVFMDLMEMSIFDFLIGNADRHRLEFFKDHEPKSVLLLDNGKSFGNPAVDELTILAPLYQCCRIRRRLYSLILQYSEINFGALLNDRYLKIDPLYPVLTESHLEAVNRRLRKVLSVLSSCIDQFGQETVLVDDGY